MNTHARRGEAGFSFVELLITIVIAGIAFAAMVPLFVSAQKQTSADNMRNVTMQVAQEKIEKIRLLDYDQVTQAHLDDEAFADAQFGNIYVYRVGSGATRDLTVTYSVALVPATQANGTPTPDGKENYKKIDVTVGWTGPPLPMRPATLSTLVYRQYAGAQVRRLDIGPDDIFSIDSNGKYVISSGPVVLDAYIAPEDIAGMNADLGDPTIPAIKRRMGYVRFTIKNQNGIDYESVAVYTYVTGEPGHYRFTWDNSAAGDGVYTFSATATSGSQQQGLPASIAHWVAAGRPPAPTGLAATPGDGRVMLTWETSPIGDFGHYEVWGSTDGVTFALLADDLATPSHTDTGLTNGTTYYYKVCVVDSEATPKTSPFSSVETGVPERETDTTPPTAPATLTAARLAGTPTVQLNWSASTDASGVAGYFAERSADGVTWTQILADHPQLGYIDADAGWTTAWRYRVRAQDVVGLWSPYSPVASVPAGTIPSRTLTISNVRGVHVGVWVQNATTGLWYSATGTSSSTKPSATTVLKNKSKTWAPLPAGIYNVTNNAVPPFPPRSIDLTYGDGSVEI